MATTSKATVSTITHDGCAATAAIQVDEGAPVGLVTYTVTVGLRKGDDGTLKTPAELKADLAQALDVERRKMLPCSQCIAGMAGMTM
jgi:hypothetical protein